MNGDPKARPHGRVTIERTVCYARREDGWYVQPHIDAAFERFATPDATEATVKQLIRKEYDDRY